MKIIKISIIFCFLICHPVMASDVYSALFNYQLEGAPTRSLIGDYSEAASSKTKIAATLKWEKFLNNYSYETPDEVEDLTHLIYVRQAHFELARLYYFSGHTLKADALIIRASEYTVYSSPEIDNGGQWCEIHNYCKQTHNK